MTADSSGLGHGYFACCCGRAGACTSGTWSATGHSLLRIEHGFEHARVGAAPADIAVERLAGLFTRGRRVLVEQRYGRHHEPGRAEAAHRAVVRDECLLHRVEYSALRQPFDGADFFPLRL